MTKQRIQKLILLIFAIIGTQVLFKEALYAANVNQTKFYTASILCIFGYFVHNHIVKKMYNKAYDIFAINEFPISKVIKDTSVLLKEFSFTFYILAIGISADTDFILLKQIVMPTDLGFIFIGIVFLIASILLPIISILLYLAFSILRLIPLYYAPRNYSTFKELEEIQNIWKKLGYFKDNK